MYTSPFRLPLLIICLCCCGMAALHAEPMVRNGDRVVFFGDSITQQRIYTRYVMDYVALRYPELAVTFRTVGWSGDKASDGLRRLQRDVLPLQPTLVVVCFGMNDGNYQAFQAATYAGYLANIRAIVRALVAEDIRVVLMTAPCIDPPRCPKFPRYNDTLGQFALGVRAVAAQEGVPVADVFSTTLWVQNAYKAGDAKRTISCDGMHPGEAGHAIVATKLLEVLGMAEATAGLEIDVTRGKALATRCQLVNLKVGENELSFFRADDTLPALFTPEAQRIAIYYPVLHELIQYRFRVKGLSAGMWQLEAQGVTVGAFSTEALTNGVNLAYYPGPWRTRWEEVDRYSSEQEELFFFRWRTLALTQPPTELEESWRLALARADAVIAEKEQARAEIGQGSRLWEWKLRKVE